MPDALPGLESCAHDLVCAGWDPLYEQTTNHDHHDRRIQKNPEEFLAPVLPESEPNLKTF
jgi:hypothetical protein